jgi:hypothetical protein
LDRVDFISNTDVDIEIVVPVGTTGGARKEPEVDIKLKFDESKSVMLMLSGEQMIFLLRVGTKNFLEPINKVDSMWREGRRGRRRAWD